MLRFASGVLAALLCSTPALATEKDGEDCVRTKVYDSYGPGWNLRTLTSATLGSGATKSYLVTLYQGNEYKFEACGDDNAEEIDLLLYDLEGKPAHREEVKGSEPVLTLSPDSTTTYYLVVYAREVKADAGVGVAITYR